MVAVGDILSANNPVFSAYCFYSAILVVKMLAMSILTARQRMKKNIFISPEDTTLGGRTAKVKYDDPDIERVRRGHLNDLENILPFFVTGFLYLFVDPSPFLAVNLFRIFTAARVAHTVVYTVVVIPQPARAIAFFVGNGVTIYMALQVILKFL